MVMYVLASNAWLCGSSMLAFDTSRLVTILVLLLRDVTLDLILVIMLELPFLDGHKVMVVLLREYLGVFYWLLRRMVVILMDFPVHSCGGTLMLLKVYLLLLHS
jgi:hypothetical protein